MDLSQSQAAENQPAGQIHKGMAVYDVNNEYVGKVELVHPGLERAATQVGNLVPNDVPPADVPEVLPGTVIASNFTGDERPQAVGEETPAGIVADLFAPDQLPPEVLERLQQHGFLRIEGRGLFARDRYVMLEQVAAVTADRVLLRVPREGLIKT